MTTVAATSFVIAAAPRCSRTVFARRLAGRRRERVVAVAVATPHVDDLAGDPFPRSDAPLFVKKGSFVIDLSPNPVSSSLERLFVNLLLTPCKASLGAAIRLDYAVEPMFVLA